MLKSTHFAITLIAILFVTIVASAKVAYVVTLWMDPNFSHVYKYNLWLPQISMKILMKSEDICHPLLVASIDEWNPSCFYNGICN